MGACGSSPVGGSQKKRHKHHGKSNHAAAVAPLVHQVAFLGFAHSGKAAVVRHFTGRVADMREAAESSQDKAVQGMADAWSVVASKKQGRPDFFGAPTFNARVSNMPVSLHDVPEDKWCDGSEEAQAYLWTMSGVVLVLDARNPDLFAAARAAVDAAMEARCPLLILLNNVTRSKAAALGALEVLARGFGLDAAPLKAAAWAVDVHYEHSPASIKAKAAEGGGRGGEGGTQQPVAGEGAREEEEDTAAANTQRWCCGKGWPTTVGAQAEESGSDAVELKNGDLPAALRGRVLTSFPQPLFFDSSPGAPPGTPHLCKGLTWLLRTIAKGGTI